MNVYKSKKVFLLRPRGLGLGLALVWAFFVLFITIIAIVSGQSSRLIELFKIIYPGYQLTLLGLLFGLIWGFIYAYILGFLTGYIYSKLAIKRVEESATFLYDIDFNKRVNLIQKGDGDNPYTIVFVANPAIALNGATHPLVPDPILANKELFYQVVLRCLRSFAANELMRLPQIFTRLRLITIFDDTRSTLNNANALCENVEEIVTVLAPRQNLQTIKDYVQNTTSDISDFPDLAAIPIDVIYTISASDTLTRSAARFTQGELTTDAANGKEFEYTFSNDPTTFTPTDKRLHAYYADFPGVIALSAWDDRLKTPVHEFAHAMSSIENGVIYDEYVDSGHGGFDPGIPSIINRKHRTNPTDPIPDVFAKYKCDNNEIVYASDRYRNDKGPDWTSYTPERPEFYTDCIMDVSYYRYLFDKFIFDFMYDRLITKINRPPAP